MAATVKAMVMASDANRGGIHPFFNPSLRNTPRGFDETNTSSEPTGELGSAAEASYTLPSTQTTLFEDASITSTPATQDDLSKPLAERAKSKSRSPEPSTQPASKENTAVSFELNEPASKRRKISQPSQETLQDPTTAIGAPETSYRKDAFHILLNKTKPGTHMNGGQHFGKENGASDLDIAVEDECPPQVELAQPSGEVASKNETTLEETSLITSSPNHVQYAQQSDNLSSSVQDVRPRKVLKLNGKGGFGSPSSKETNMDNRVHQESASTEKRRRGRPRKSLVAVLNYGLNSEGTRTSLGLRIGEILSSSTRQTESSTATDDIKCGPEISETAKQTHPFFLGKPAAQPKLSEVSPVKENTSDSPIKVKSFSTPRKLNFGKVHRIEGGQESPNTRAPAHYRDGKAFKLPGTVEPHWPWNGVVRVIPNSDMIEDSPKIPRVRDGYQQFRKQKSKLPWISPLENVVSKTNEGLKYQRGNHLHELKLPARLVMGCRKVELYVKNAISEEGKALGGPVVKGYLTETVSNGDGAVDNLHPACSRLLRKLSSSLSAYDRGDYDNQAWCQKYAPTSITEVLQPRKELDALKSWLQGLAINAVDSGVRVTGVVDEKGNKRKLKKKKKPKDLDDFIVSSDGEDTEMHELNDSDDGETDQITMVPRSIVQSFDSSVSNSGEKSKRANAVLISGPHGCGKTAAAYAVAKELGFNVFEINSGSRRSGKDILDKVGDMASNHQVRKVDVLAETTESADESVPLPEMDQHQRTLGSFFGKAKPKAQKPTVKRSKLSVKRQAEPPKKSNQVRQQQSLVLLEEVDVLFEEDKQFWETLTDLMGRSKRPFILTCNDESLLPLESLNLFGIFRFKNPPAQLVSPYLLALTAGEGHLLTLETVNGLYECNGRDLRATITALDYWCQMAVGDKKGGMEWMLPRWPRGADLDKDGDTLRVMSEGTYRDGIGLLSEDAQAEVAEGDEYLAEELLLQAWSGWDIDPLMLFEDALEARVLQNEKAQPTQPPSERYALLVEMDHHLDHLSSIDIYSAVDLPGSSAPRLLDPTQPPQPAKSRLDHLEGTRTLQADEAQDHRHFDAQIATFLPARLAPSSSLLRSLPPALRTPGPSLTHARRATAARLTHALAPLTNADAHTTLDRSLTPIATDLAPFVRAIAAFDAALERHRAARESRAKRPRTTRAARSALEGSQRAVTRRERWFRGLDLEAVLRTGGEGWPRLTRAETPSAEAEAAAGGRVGQSDGESGDL